MNITSEKALFHGNSHNKYESESRQRLFPKTLTALAPAEAACLPRTESETAFLNKHGNGPDGAAYRVTFSEALNNSVQEMSGHTGRT